MKGAASSLGNIKAALPYMDTEMRELEKRTLSKGGALAEREYAELYQTEARKRYTECGSDSCFFQREGFIPYPLKMVFHTVTDSKIASTQEGRRQSFMAVCARLLFIFYDRLFHSNLPNDDCVFHYL